MIKTGKYTSSVSDYKVAKTVTLEKVTFCNKVGQGFLIANHESIHNHLNIFDYDLRN